MCAAHLPAEGALRDEVVQRKQQLARYQQALDADPTLNTWQQVRPRPFRTGLGWHADC